MSKFIKGWMWDSMKIILFSAAVIVLIGVLLLRGYEAGCEDVRKEAVRAGVAHYISNPETGEPEFTFRKMEELGRDSLVK